MLGAVMVVDSAIASENEVLQLSPREREQVVGHYVRPDGRTVPLVENQGIPFLYGLGDARGKASSVPLVNGRTSTIEASTPSNGIVPGQEPE
ncbi:hypothetical protein [Aureimonas sp. AU20]|uniref:hypothetical protein n=1 Tax=Aureimonas sp. AU20 TaxID=1349819 RepID=UPI00178C9D75|nr:hypothetical protein [Aureimonas sp. AU20]